jgi:tRNA threonylcarbamoyladenosine biosynthesis protein TsaE
VTGASLAEGVTVATASAAETRRLGKRLGRRLEAGDVVLLEGTLGAGKTVLVQGIAEGLDVADPVTSPTFTLVHEYQGRLPLYHADLYRIAGETEAVDLGLEDLYYGDGVTVVEWAGRAAALVPREHLWVRLEVPRDDGSTRRITFHPSGRRWVTMLKDFGP